MSEYVKKRGLNHYGVKNSSDMWRTINGVLWPHFAIEEAPDHASYLRKAGVRVRRFGEEIFVHPDDIPAACEADDQRRAAARAAKTASQSEDIQS